MNGQVEVQPETQPEGRPYRSHKLPACTTCRNRKGRCHVDDSSQPCRYCRQRSLACDHGLNAKPTSVQRGHARKRMSRTQGSEATSTTSPRTDHSSLPQISFEQMQTPSESSPMMVDPTMADDLDVLERHLASQSSADGSETRPYVRISNTPNESIVYRTVPRLRKGLQSTSYPGVAQREIMENVLGPLHTQVIRLYFDVINPSFPILDETSFWRLWQKEPKRISSTLMCDIYAVALPYWSFSESLRNYPRPDVQFAWNQAVLALRDDFMAPSLTTVHAALLDLLGRPIFHVTGNIINARRTVGLAHSQGLHRDPSMLRVSSAERSLRTRVWWAVLIHDHWSSLSHGTPPNIVSENHDVPLPELDNFITSSASEAHRRASTSFYHLCWLTRILGDMLPLVYSLRVDYKAACKSVRRSECALDDWEDALPDYLGVYSQDNVPQADSHPWSSGLWFYYLTLKLMLTRIAFRVILRHNGEGYTQEALRHFRFHELHNSASALIDFVASLQGSRFREFWLPYTAYLLVSATTTLLRCTVESSKVEDKKRSASSLLRFLETLRVAHQVHDWDLAVLCMETCGKSIEKIAAANGVLTQTVTTTPPAIPSHASDPRSLEPYNSAEQDVTATQPLTEDFNLPFSLDIPWDHLWDDMAEPWGLRYTDSSLAENQP